MKYINKLITGASLRAGALLVALVSVSATGAAADSDMSTDSNASRLQISGFVSLIGGSTFNGSFGPNYAANGGPAQLGNVNCPCFIADYSNAAIYNNRFSVMPESRAGVQLQYTLTPDLNFVGQVVVRGADTNPNVQWAYFSYKINDQWEAHLGRQRLPLYYYSLFQDVGFAYPWVNVPPELYGWEVTNYDGATLRYHNSFGNTNLTSSVFGGQEVLGHSLFFSMYQPGDTDVSWKHIFGVDAEINNGPLTVRGVYIQSGKSDSNSQIDSTSEANQKFYGLAVNLDFDSWFVLSEVTEQKVDPSNVTPTYTLTAPASTIGAGWRIGKWTPFVNYALFTQHSTNTTVAPESGYRRTSFTLRYDIDSNSDFKAEVDRNLDTAANSFGNTNVFRISYDRVF